MAYAAVARSAVRPRPRPRFPRALRDYEEPEPKCVGITKLLNQVELECVKRGFDFNLMVIGEPGIGKSTLVNSLFLTNFFTAKPQHSESVLKMPFTITEKGGTLRVNIIKTPWFGNDESWRVAENYVIKQLEKFRKEEMGVKRNSMMDDRVHCCLYFISPSGHSLKPIDVEFMKALHNIVNIVPVIAKADSLTPEETHAMKSKVLTAISDSKLNIYQLPTCDLPESSLAWKQYQEMKKRMPFAVVGSSQVKKINNQTVRCRVYPWGIVEVNNPAHCDLIYLRKMLVHSYMLNLKHVTHKTLYENYRLSFVMLDETDDSSSEDDVSSSVEDNA